MYFLTAPVATQGNSLLSKIFGHSYLVLLVQLAINNDLSVARPLVDFAGIHAFEPCMFIETGEKQIQALGLYGLAERKQLLHFTWVEID